MTRPVAGDDVREVPAVNAESKIRELVSIVAERNSFQEKALDGLLEKLNPEEKAGFAALLDFYLRQGDTIEHLADCYLKFLQDIFDEQIYFVENGRYRYSSIGEVNAFFYQNPQYMEYYMKGLAVSTYLLESHRKCRAWYESKIKDLRGGGAWLDAGVGHGEYFILAIQHTRFERYLGIDISPTCVQMCREMVAKRAPERLGNVEVREQDFFQYDGPVCDAVVLGEILEHVEEPKRFLKKIHEITHEGSFIYIVTVVNCPQKDHIYRFRSAEEIEDLYRCAGFDIDDKIVFSTNGSSLERAIKRQTAIMTAHVLKRRG